MTKDDIIAANPDVEFSDERKMYGVNSMAFQYPISGQTGRIFWGGDYHSSASTDAKRAWSICAANVRYAASHAS